MRSICIFGVLLAGAHTISSSTMTASDIPVVMSDPFVDALSLAPKKKAGCPCECGCGVTGQCSCAPQKLPIGPPTEPAAIPAPVVEEKAPAAPVIYRQVCENGVCRMVPVESMAAPVSAPQYQPSYPMQGYYQPPPQHRRFLGRWRR